MCTHLYTRPSSLVPYGTVLASNQQLQRTVRRRRVRAASAALQLCARGAHVTAVRRR
jgi:hypothetical protein